MWGGTATPAPPLGSQPDPQGTSQNRKDLSGNLLEIFHAKSWVSDIDSDSDSQIDPSTKHKVKKSRKNHKKDPESGLESKENKVEYPPYVRLQRRPTVDSNACIDSNLETETKRKPTDTTKNSEEFENQKRDLFLKLLRGETEDGNQPTQGSIDDLAVADNNLEYSEREKERDNLGAGQLEIDNLGKDQLNRENSEKDQSERYNSEKDQLERDISGKDQIERDNSGKDQSEGDNLEKDNPERNQSIDKTECKNQHLLREELNDNIQKSQSSEEIKLDTQTNINDPSDTHQPENQPINVKTEDIKSLESPELYTENNINKDVNSDEINTDVVEPIKESKLDENTTKSNNQVQVNDFNSPNSPKRIPEDSVIVQSERKTTESDTHRAVNDTIAIPQITYQEATPCHSDASDVDEQADNNSKQELPDQTDQQKETTNEKHIKDSHDQYQDNKEVPAEDIEIKDKVTQRQVKEHSPKEDLHEDSKHIAVCVTEKPGNHNKKITKITETVDDTKPIDPINEKSLEKSEKGNNQPKKTVKFSGDLSEGDIPIKDPISESNQLQSKVATQNVHGILKEYSKEYLHSDQDTANTEIPIDSYSQLGRSDSPTNSDTSDHHIGDSDSDCTETGEEETVNDPTDDKSLEKLEKRNNQPKKTVKFSDNQSDVDASIKEPTSESSQFQSKVVTQNVHAILKEYPERGSKDNKEDLHSDQDTANTELPIDSYTQLERSDSPTNSDASTFDADLEENLKFKLALKRGSVQLRAKAKLKKADHHIGNSDNDFTETETDIDAAESVTKHGQDQHSAPLVDIAEGEDEQILIFNESKELEHTTHGIVHLRDIVYDSQSQPGKRNNQRKKSVKFIDDLSEVDDSIKEPTSESNQRQSKVVTQSVNGIKVKKKDYTVSNDLKAEEEIDIVAEAQRDKIPTPPAGKPKKQLIRKSRYSSNKNTEKPLKQENGRENSLNKRSSKSVEEDLSSDQDAETTEIPIVSYPQLGRPDSPTTSETSTLDSDIEDRSLKFKLALKRGSVQHRLLRKPKLQKASPLKLKEVVIKDRFLSDEDIGVKSSDEQSEKSIEQSIEKEQSKPSVTENDKTTEFKMSARSRSASPSGRSKSKDPSPPVDLPPDVMTENIPIIAKYDTPGGPTGDPLEEVAQHLFNKMNTANDGKLTPKEVEMFFKCPSMKAMSKQDTKKLRSFIKWKKKSIPVENLVSLARELMRLQYNIPGAVEILSNEEGELCHWVEVHLGKHTFYFNKQTTDATYKMPEEYFSSLDTTLFYDGVLHLLRLELEGSEDDMELPFEELIRMIQGGLTLSDKDLKAILKQCKKTKENSMAPKEFIPFVRRQIMEAYENKKAMPTDWCPMVSPRYGTFFYNKKTGQVSQNTPEELLKHHHSMVDRKETIAAGLKKALEEKAEVIEELENERKLKQELEETLEDMQLQANKLNRDMNKSNSSLEKSRQEGQKKDVNIEKLERDKTVMEQKIKDLEIRASEADKLDREVDKVRGQLDASQQNTRERDHEIRQLQSTLASTQKELEVAKEKIHMQNEKILDLRAQVREELARNEKVEKNLDTIPRLKDRIETQDEEIKTVKKQLEEKTYQVQWCRKNVKETKEKTKQNDFDYVEHVKLAREDEVIKSENVTLKGLLRGKDILIVQKSQELDLARSILTELENDEDEDFAWRVQEVKERRCRLHPTFGDNNNGNEGNINGDNTSMKEVKVQQYRKPQQKGGKSGKIDINNPPFALSNSTSESSDNWEHNHKQQTHRHESKFLEDVLLDNSDNDEQDAFMYTRNQSSPRESTDYNQNKRSPRSGSEIKRPKTAFARTTQYRTDRDFREDRNLGKSYDSDRDHRRSKTEPIRRPHSVNSDVKTVSSLMTLYDEDTLKSQFVNMGDRVLIKLPQAKSKQQGKGKGSQGGEMPQVAGGIVKYVGEMDDNTNSHRIRVGVKMDDTVGDTDGMFKGKRYFFVPKDHGRIVKISNVISVLDTKTAKYKPMKQCVKELLSDAITDVQPAHED